MPSANSQTMERTKIKVPSKWTVLIKNDDFTPMDFVISVLERVFHLPTDDAIEITMRIHEEGQAFVGEFTKEVAEMKAYKLISLAEAQGHPLFASAAELSL